MSCFKKLKSNTSAKMSLFSIFSILSVIIICLAVLNLLDLAKNTYLKTIKGSKKEPPKQHITALELKPQNQILRKLYVLLYLASEKAENKDREAALKENEFKAVKLLKQYAKAQLIYKNHYGYYAKHASDLILEINGKHTIIDPALKVLNASFNKDNPSDGYYFIELVKSSLKDPIGSFFLSAVPAEHEVSGINTLCIFSTKTQPKLVKKNNHAKPVFDISAIDNSWESFPE